MVKNEQYTLIGWDWKEWLKGNKEAAKLVIAALFGLWIPVNPAVAVLLAAVLKLGLDSLDYWAKK